MAADGDSGPLRGRLWPTESRYRRIISLDSPWRFRADPGDTGVSCEWPRHGPPVDGRLAVVVPVSTTTLRLS
eukprot:scaffold14520_cov109-Isochrysis_galbana.AAC.8